MKPLYLLGLIILGSLWGASFVFIMIAGHDLGPAMMMWIRVTSAALILAGIAALRRQLPDPRLWRGYLLLGLTNAALPFTMFAIAEQTISASLTSILNATTPVFTVLIVWPWLGERPTARKLFGAFLGIVGVFILVGGTVPAGWYSLVFGAGPALVAAISYSVANTFASTSFRSQKPLASAVGQFLAASLILLPFAVFDAGSVTFRAETVAAMIGLVLLSTVVGYLLYFWLSTKVAPVQLSTLTLFVPMFGSLWSVIFLGESFSAIKLLGLLVVLVAVATILTTRGFILRSLRGIAHRFRGNAPQQSTSPPSWRTVFPGPGRESGLNDR